MSHLLLIARLVVAVGAATLVQPLMAGPVLDRIKANGHVVIAHRESSVPFSFVTSEGRPVGYAVDLCLKVVDMLRRQLPVADLKPRFVMVTPTNRMAMVEEGKADLECGSTTNNAERRQKVAFTVPHYIAGARYLVRADSPVQEVKDFKGRTVVSTRGTTPLKALMQANSQYLMGIRVVDAPDHARAVDMVASAEADGFVMDDVLLYGLTVARSDAERFKVVGKFLTIEPLAIMLSRSDADFKKLVDDEMKRLIQTREAHAIYERWFLKPILPGNRSLNLPMNHLLKDFWKYPTDQVPG